MGYTLFLFQLFPLFDLENAFSVLDRRTSKFIYIHKLTITFFGLTKKHIIGSLQIGIAI